MEKIIVYKGEYAEANPHLNNFLFWGISIDILFLPYLPFAAVSASVLLVALWMMLNIRRVSNNREQTFFIFMVILMVIGTVMNVLYTGEVRLETSFGTVIKRLFQYIFCFETYFFYKNYFSTHKVNLKKIIFVAILYIAVFAILFKLFPHEYATIKLSVNPADNHTRRYLANTVYYRFNYLWTDPNNISYLMAGLCAWFLMKKDVSLAIKSIVLVAATFIAFCTVSNGGIIMLLLMCVMVAFYALKKVFKTGMKPNTFVCGMLLIVIAFVAFRFTELKSIISTDYLSLFTERLNMYSSGVVSTGGRLEDIKKALPLLNPIMLLVGTGNEGIAYEIGHIYWIGMYGVPAYCIFMWLMFRKESYQKWRQCIWMIPFFVGFTMNIAIGEYKWMAIYLMLLAYSRYGDDEQIG